MKVEIDNESGFCFGVVNAISKAEEQIASGGRLVSLGDIVHNGAEVARLEAMGLEVVPEVTDLATLAGRTVLIRAHGEPPATYRKAGECGVCLIDATCPVVARLQKTVAEASEKMKRAGGRVVILGKRGHAEVRGLAGQAEDVGGGQAEDGVVGQAEDEVKEQVGGWVEVIENEADLDRLDFTRPIYFLAQTTSSLAEFRRLGEEIRRRAAEAEVRAPETPGTFDAIEAPQAPVACGQEVVTVHDTVCRQVAGREEHLVEFARRHDVVVFVAGAKSSNGRVLFDAVKAANPLSFKIENAGELHAEWFVGKDSVGVCGATSTPKWLMEEVADAVISY